MRSNRGLRFLVLTAAAAAFLLAPRPIAAERVTAFGDMAFEIQRVISQNRGGTNESIAPSEEVPQAGVWGKTQFVGTVSRFPQRATVEVWNGKAWQSATTDWFASPVPGTEQSPVPLWTVVFRFDALQVQGIQNRWVLFKLFPPSLVGAPSLPAVGDNLELLFVRAGSP